MLVYILMPKNKKVQNYAFIVMNAICVFYFIINESYFSGILIFFVHIFVSFISLKDYRIEKESTSKRKTIIRSTLIVLFCLTSTLLAIELIPLLNEKSIHTQIVFDYEKLNLKNLSLVMFSALCIVFSLYERKRWK